MAGMNGSRAYKVSPEEANGLEWAQKERRSKPMGSMQKSENGPQQTQSNTNKESKGLMEDPLARRMRYKVIELGKPKRVSKGLQESRIGKGPRSPKKTNGPRTLKREIGHRSPQIM